MLALVKAAAAGAFVINRLKAAEAAAQGNPTLCKVFAAPAQKFTAALTGLVRCPAVRRASRVHFKARGAS